MTLNGKTAFVSGGSGFIGGRLIEVLRRQYGMNVRTLVRTTTGAGGGAFRAAAAGAEIVFGSLLDPASLDQAVAGCDFVFHCAYGTHGSLKEQREVTVEGTRLLARAAAKAGVRHFVHLSTVASYGGNTPPVVEADWDNPKLWPWPYAHDKLDAEKALADEARAGSLPHTVLRLGAVYGPYGTAYTVMPLTTMTAGPMAIVDDGEGVSSATYVDDVIQAMLRAAARDGTGERFMVRGPDRVTWGEFYRCYEAMLGTSSLVSMTRAEMDAARKGAWRVAVKKVVPEALSALKASPGFRATAGQLPLVRTAYSRFGKRFVPKAAIGGGNTAQGSATGPTALIPDLMVDYFANRSEFSIEKTREKLGYQPRYDLARGMALTEAWAKWANFVPSKGG